MSDINIFRIMGKFTEFKVPLKMLTKGEHTYTYHLDKVFFKNMESTDVRDADLEVTLKVVYTGELYNLDFKVEGTVTTLCDRCLDDLVLPIDTDYAISVKYGDDYNDDSDTLMEIPYSDNDLNVAYMIYDTVSLAIPIKHVHPLGKCNRAMTTMLKKHRATGIDGDDMADEMMDEIESGSFDDNTPSDPRWDALKGLGSDED